MASITDFMTNDHRACDDIFALAEESVANGKWPKAKTEFATFCGEIERHLAMEENILFPAFETKSGMQGGPTVVMRSEHEQMRKLIADMAQTVQDNNRDGYLGLSETLMVLTQQHNMKEEQMLYHMMDQTFGPEANALLVSAGAAL